MLFFHNINRHIKQKFCSPPDKHVSLSEKRAPYATFRINAGLTLEASLVMPLFLAAFVALIFFLQIIQQNLHIQKALYNQVQKIAGYSYYINEADISEDVSKYLEAAYIKSAVVKEVGQKYLDNSYIKNGSKGIYLNITGKPEDGILDVALEYKMQVPFDLFNIGGLNMVSRARCHLWIGSDKNALVDDTEYVYMTPSGSVYHLYKDCTYIKSDILSCIGAEIYDERNASGAKYYKCQVCKPLLGMGKVYYTKYGTRFHYSDKCVNLHSDVFAVEKSKVKDKYRMCTKCAKNAERSK